MKYFENYQNVTQRQEVRKYCWKNGASRLACVRVAINLQFVKKKKKKKKKERKKSAKHNEVKHNKNEVCLY